MPADFKLIREVFEFIAPIKPSHQLNKNELLAQIEALARNEKSLNSRGELRTRTVILGRNKHYSKRGVDDESLIPVNLLELNINEIGVGKILLVKIISAPVKTTAIQFIVVDSNKNPTIVLLYNIPNKNTPYLNEIYPVDSVYAILEPNLRETSSSDGYTVRIDSPSDLVRLYPSSPLLKSSNLLPPSTKSPEELKLLGNKCFTLGGIGNYWKALDYYSAALDGLEKRTGLNAPAILSNRGFTFQKLGKYAMALKDYQEARILWTPLYTLSIKIIFRTGLAYYSLRKFWEAGSNFDVIVNSERVTEEAIKFREDSRERVGEEQGIRKFDFGAIGNGQAHGDFMSGIEMKESIGKGRGLFATRDLKVGELVLVEKALAEGKREESTCVIVGANLFTETMANYSFVEMIAVLVEKMGEEEEFKKKVLGLHPGEGFDSIGVDEKGIDISRVESIATFNSFHNETIFDKAGKAEDLLHAPSAIFKQASLLNHSCIGNITYNFVGSTIFFVVKEEIKKGAELFDSYVDSLESYSVRAKKLEAHGFVCDCKLCDYDRIEGPNTKILELTEKISTLTDEFYDSPTAKITSMTQLNQITPIIQELVQCYGGERTLKPRMYSAYRIYSQAMWDIASLDPNVEKPIESMMKILELEISALECLGMEFLKQGETISNWQMKRGPQVGTLNAVLSLLFISKMLGKKRGKNFIQFAKKVELGATGELIPFEKRFGDYLEKMGIELE